MSVPYLTVCILCAFLGIAFLYRFVWYSGAAERDMRQEPTQDHRQP